MKRVLLLTMATCAWFTNHSVAQEQPGGYHTVTCIKVRDGKTAEYTRFADESRKVAQAAADSGLMAVGYRFRSVMPAGAAATSTSNSRWTSIWPWTSSRPACPRH